MKTRRVLAILTILSLAGCSISPQVVNMVPAIGSQNFVPTNKILKVNLVTGGKDSDPLFAGSRIDNMSYYGALVQALEKSNLFRLAKSSETPDLVLTAQVIHQSQPAMGFDMTASMVTKYTLTKQSDGTVVWQKDILSKYTAKMGESLIGATRLRKANEGAVRLNIEYLINELAGLKFE